MESTAGASLEALWKEFESRWRRLFSRFALRELVLRASFDVRPISPSRVENDIPLGDIPDCERCTDLCCLGLENVVSLRLKDIANLIDLGRTDLIERKKPVFPPELVRRRPWLGELMTQELWRTLPVMKQVGEHRLCAALTKELKCALHPRWPTSCERFPYSLATRRESPRPRRVVWGSRCPAKRSSPSHKGRSRELFFAAIDSYNERIKDAVLLTHARERLDEIGIGAWLIRGEENPFEEPQVGGNEVS